MARIKPVSSAQAGLRVKIAYHFTRRSIGKLILDYAVGVSRTPTLADGARRPAPRRSARGVVLSPGPNGSSGTLLPPGQHQWNIGAVTAAGAAADPGWRGGRAGLTGHTGRQSPAAGRTGHRLSPGSGRTGRGPAARLPPSGTGSTAAPGSATVSGGPLQLASAYASSWGMWYQADRELSRLPDRRP